MERRFAVSIFRSYSTCAEVLNCEPLSKEVSKMKSSTKDKIEGTTKEATGKLKEKVGEAMDDPGMRDRGTAEKIGGKVQRKVGDVKKAFGK
jgi:uncharacterized protein YjbJ (UPF0337 family)